MDTKITNNEIKQKNRTSIFQLFRERDQLSRQDIAAALDLSLPTVTQNLQQLKAEGLIAETGTIGNTGGRRARAYSLVKNARTAIGLDITKDHVTAVALDLNGSIIATVRRSLTFTRTDDYYRSLGDIVAQTVRQGRLKGEHILGVGIGVPGLITRDQKTVFYGAVLGVADVSCEEFSKYIPYPTMLCHDTNTAGFAEIWNYPDTPTAFYLMLSASIGGAVYIDGKQYDGLNLRAGEAGHMVIVPGGKRCYCGNRGCMDAYCAARVLTSAADGSLERFFRLLKQGDPRIRAVWEEYLEHLVTAVNNLRMLFDCNIIIGGHTGSFMDEYIDELRDRLARRNPFEDAADYLMPCRYKTEAVATGAALNYISAFLDSI